MAKAEKAKKLDGAREHLIQFTEYTKPAFKCGWFHRKLAQNLEQFLQDVVDGKKPRLIICAPPQHGKTELTSRRFPTWAMGKHPELRFICASYAATWSDAISTDRHRIMAQPEYAELFPDLVLTKKRVEEIQNSAGGFMLAAGVDCGITGRSSDIGIIDDPIKGYKEATSELTKEAIWNWYRTDFYTRLQSGAGVIVMMTRWAEDDLVGRLLDEMKAGGEQWTVINYPAIAEEDEEFRKAGECLSVERFDLEDLQRKKRTLGSYAFGALYQGHPAPAEGLMLKRDYWQYYTGDLPKFELIVISVDAAFKNAEDSDHVAIHMWGFVGSRGYLLKRTCERMGYTAMKAAIASYAINEKWRPHVLLIEEAANGPAALEELHRALGSKLIVIGVPTGGGKLARAWPFAAELEAGNAYLPQLEPWSGDIVEYASKFPTSPMDHDIDAMTHCFNWRRENAHGLFSYYENETKKLIEAGKPSLMAPLSKIAEPEPAPGCPTCTSAAVRETQLNPDGGRWLRCNQCGHEWFIEPPKAAQKKSLFQASPSLPTRAEGRARWLN